MTDKMPDAYIHVCDAGSSLFHTAQLAEQKRLQWGGDVIPLFRAALTAQSVNGQMLEALKKTTRSALQSAELMNMSNIETKALIGEALMSVISTFEKAQGEGEYNLSPKEQGVFRKALRNSVKPVTQDKREGK